MFLALLANNSALSCREEAEFIAGKTGGAVVQPANVLAAGVASRLPPPRPRRPPGNTPVTEEATSLPRDPWPRRILPRPFHREYFARRRRLPETSTPSEHRVRCLRRGGPQNILRSRPRGPSGQAEAGVTRRSRYSNGPLAERGPISIQTFRRRPTVAQAIEGGVNVRR